MSELQSKCVHHIVLFKFIPAADKKQIDIICNAFVALLHKCLHKDTGLRYIVSIQAGHNMSIEDFSGGITHGFIVLFKNPTDRDYYVNTDPAHLAFGKLVGPWLDKPAVRVVDFQDGHFEIGK